MYKVPKCTSTCKAKHSKAVNVDAESKRQGKSLKRGVWNLSGVIALCPSMYGG